MKKIGFIDYFLDEWHAEKYPEWIREASNGNMTVAYAYGMTDSPSGLSNAEWCAQRGIQLLDSIEEVVSSSDYLIVLSPDHPEYHEELSALALRSGKPTYIDKTFAPDREAAIRLFELAERHGTPLFSSSALRFATEYREADRAGIDFISSTGPGNYNNYSVHQIEPVVSLMGNNPGRVMWIGTAHTPALLIGYEDGRQALIQHAGNGCPFGMVVNRTSGNAEAIKVESDFFASFIKHMVTFFETGEPVVEPADTIAIMTVIEYGKKAAETPYHWLELPV